MAPEQAVLAALAVPLLGAALIALAGRAPNLRESVTLITAVTLLGCVLTLLPALMAGGRDQGQLVRLRIAHPDLP